jgi:hypothetical protein
LPPGGVTFLRGSREGQLSRTVCRENLKALS